MSATEPLTPAPSARGRSFVRIAIAIALVLTVIPLGLYGFSRARGKGDWPAAMPPPVRSPSAGPATDPAAWTLMQQLFAGAADPSARPPAHLARVLADDDAVAGEERLRENAERLAAFERLVAMAPAELPPMPASSEPTPRYIALLRVLDVALLRARSMPPGEAARSLASYERFASRFAHGGHTLFTAMIGVALEGHVLREIERLHRRTPTLSADELAPLATALDEAVALPSPLARSAAGECAGMETVLRGFDSPGDWQRLTQLSTDGDDRPLSSHIGLPMRWSYDAERTVAALRARCQTEVNELAATRYPRSLSTPPRLLHAEPTAVWQLFDNHVGRVLLDTSQSSMRRYVQRDEALIATRSLARVGLAIRRYAATTGSLPDRLDALAPSVLAAAPGAAVAGRPLTWDRATRAVSIELPAVTRGEQEHVAPTRWQFVEPVPAPTAAPAPVPAPAPSA